MQEKLIDKLIEECTENIEEIKLKILWVKIKLKINADLAHFTLCYFGYFSYSL